MRVPASRQANAWLPEHGQVPLPATAALDAALEAAAPEATPEAAPEFAASAAGECPAGRAAGGPPSARPRATTVMASRADAAPATTSVTRAGVRLKR